MYFEIIAIVAGICILLFLLSIGIAALFRYSKRKSEPHYGDGGSNKKTKIICLAVSVSLFAVTVCVLFGFFFYYMFIDWNTKGQPTYGVGNEWKSSSVSIAFDSFDCVKKDDIVEVTTRFTVVPTTAWSVEENDISLHTWKIDQPVNKDKSIEMSGFNVFETKITEEINCIFVFDMPLSIFHNADGTEITGGYNADVLAFSFFIASPLKT